MDDEKFVKVEEHEQLVRDMETGAILRINNSELQRARLAKRRQKQQITDVEELKKEVSDIKSMLQAILEKI